MSKTKGIYLIGTHHTVLQDGPSRLYAMYESLEPDLLLEEMDEADLSNHEAMLKRWRQKLIQISNDTGAIERFIKTVAVYQGFEGRVNRDYARDHNIQNLMVDLPNGQLPTLQLMDQTIDFLISDSKQKRRLDLDKLTERIVKDCHVPIERARKNWEFWTKYENTLIMEERLYAIKAAGFIGERDVYMESQIRGLFDPSKVIAFPLGAIHCIDSISRLTLYSRIKDLKPIRMPL